MPSISFPPDLFTEIWSLLGKLTHKKITQQLEYLKLENQILRSKLPKRISITQTERNKLLHFGLFLGKDLKELISIVKYATFRRWAREQLRNKPKVINKRGRPKTLCEISRLILKLAKENNWGYTRILGELRKLNINRISRSTIKNILKENGLSPAAKRSSDSWDAFIRRHFETLIACDFFTQTVWTVFGPKTFFVLFFINIRTRVVTLSGITTNPNNNWLIENTQALSFH